MFGKDPKFVVVGRLPDQPDRQLFYWYSHDTGAAIAQAHHEAEEFGFYYESYECVPLPKAKGVVATLWLVWRAKRRAKRANDTLLRAMLDDFNYHQSCGDVANDMIADELLRQIDGHMKASDTVLNGKSRDAVAVPEATNEGKA